MREWLVIENSWKNAVFAPPSAKDPVGYIPRLEAEVLLGRPLAGTVWFTKDESEKMKSHPDWRVTEPEWSPLGFWATG